MDFVARAGVSIKDILGYIPPSHPGVQDKKPKKNQRYQIRISMIPQGMVCTSDIVPALMKIEYEYHDLLAFKDVMKEPYLPIVSIEGASIERIP